VSLGFVVILVQLHEPHNLDLSIKQEGRSE
ncbi:uncharacterized protein METZ01_LOCUS80053, partial [marine metagenome]